MFSLFIRRDGLIEPPELGAIDYHCHILPGIDDGPATVEGALQIAYTLRAMKVETVVATPHVISDLYPNNSEKIRNAVDRFRQVLKDNNLDLKIHAGAEYYCEPSFLDLIAAGDVLSTGPEKYVLFETPVQLPPTMLEQTIFQLRTSGYTPLLAHAERYHYLRKDLDLAIELKRLGAAFQVNHPSFMLPGTSDRGNFARLLYKKDLVDVLGSDMHRANSASTRPRKPTDASVSSWLARGFSRSF